MDKMWYYVVGETERTGPVPESELRALISSGQVQPSDLVWAEGVGDWQPAGTFPELMGGGASGAAPAATPAAAVVVPTSAAYSAPHGTAVPEGLGGWMTFVGIMNILQGAISCLSCIGAIVGIPMIVAGAALMSAKNMLLTVQDVSPGMAPILGKLKKFLVMTGIVYIITLVGTIAYFIFIIVMVMGGGFAAAMSQP